jgi:hypothetical protein
MGSPEAKGGLSRSARVNVAGGRLTFRRGFAVGILITLIQRLLCGYLGNSLFQVMPDFTDKYAAHMVEREKAAGASQQKIDESEQTHSACTRVRDLVSWRRHA